MSGAGKRATARVLLSATTAITVCMVAVILFVQSPDQELGESRQHSMSYDIDIISGGLFFASDINVDKENIFISGAGGLSVISNGKLRIIEDSFGDMGHTSIHDGAGFSGAREGLLKFSNGSWSVYEKSAKVLDIDYIGSGVFSVISPNTDWDGFDIDIIDNNKIDTIMSISGEYLDSDILSSNSGWVLTSRRLVFFQSSNIVHDIDISNLNISSIEMVDDKNGVAVGGFCFDRFDDNRSTSNIVEIRGGQIHKILSPEKFHSFSDIHAIKGEYLIIGPHGTAVRYNGEIEVIAEGKNMLCQSKYVSSVLRDETVIAVGQEMGGVYVDEITKDGSSRTMITGSFVRIDSIANRSFVAINASNRVVRYIDNVMSGYISTNVKVWIDDIINRDKEIIVVGDNGYIESIDGNNRIGGYIAGAGSQNELFECGGQIILVSNGSIKDSEKYMNIYNISRRAAELIRSHRYKDGEMSFSCNNNNMFLIGNSGIINVYDRFGKKKDIRTPLSGFGIQIASSDDVIFLHQSGYLYLYRDSSWTRESLITRIGEEIINDVSIKKIVVDLDGRLWMGGEGFVIIMRETTGNYQVITNRSIPLSNPDPEVNDEIYDIDISYHNDMQDVLVSGVGDTILGIKIETTRRTDSELTRWSRGGMIYMPFARN